jgi:hypothetical protein
MFDIGEEFAMTVFAKKPAMNVIDWGKVQNQLGQLQLALGAPHDLMMFSAEAADRINQDIYIGLPVAPMLAAFPGFELIDRSALPDFMATLIVREDGFRERFPDIAAKRRTKYG